MDLYVGTSGYSYKAWKGYFYPEKHPDKEMLRYYGEQLTAVEINNTFYRMPKKSVLENWAEQVPETFRFSLKASRRITHFKRLKEPGDETTYMIEAAKTLNQRLGVVLFQLPPNFRKDLDRLDAFLDFLPPDLPAAFEFRHDSWEDDEVHDRLRAKGAALCVADTEEREDTPIVATASWGYLRLRRPGYDEEQLRAWASQVNEQDWSHAFVFFKHEEAGAGPKMAKQFYELAHA